MTRIVSPRDSVRDCADIPRAFELFYGELVDPLSDQSSSVRVRASSVRCGTADSCPTSVVFPSRLYLRSKSRVFRLCDVLLSVLYKLIRLMWCFLWFGSLQRYYTKCHYWIMLNMFKKWKREDGEYFFFKSRLYFYAKIIKELIFSICVPCISESWKIRICKLLYTSLTLWTIYE